MLSLLFQIFRSPWYIDAGFAANAGVLVKNMLEGKVAFDSTQLKPEAYSTILCENSESSFNVGVINISGVLMKEDKNCGPAGMDTIGEWVKELDNNPNVSCIILKFNTPGGTVSGTESLGKIIKNCNKPTIAFVDEMACSAGYWLASQCNHIFASTNRSEVGNIGVMINFMDVQPIWEKEGAVFHEIYSTLSSKKNKRYADLLKGNYEPIIKDVLDPLATDFINVVTSTRTITKKEALEGETGAGVGAVQHLDLLGNL